MQGLIEDLYTPKMAFGLNYITLIRDPSLQFYDLTKQTHVATIPLVDIMMPFTLVFI